MNLRPQYLQIPMAVICNPNLQPLDFQVYGVIHWYCHMKEQRCFASNEKIAEMLSCEERKINPKSVSNSVSRLEKAGCVQVLLKPNRQRIEIIPLVTEQPARAEAVPSDDGTKVEDYLPSNNGTEDVDELSVPSDDGRETKVVPSNNGAVFHQMMDGVPSNDGQNSNTQEEELKKNTISSNEEIQRLAAEMFGDATSQPCEKEEQVPAPTAEESAVVPLQGEPTMLPVKVKKKKQAVQNPDGSFGNPEVRECITVLRELLGGKLTKWEKNSQAAYRLIRDKGKRETLLFIRYARSESVVADRHAPVISNYMDLEEKWDKLERYFKRQQSDGKMGVRVSGLEPNITPNTKYDNISGGIAWH